MKLIFTAAILVASVTTAAAGDTQPLTVEQCIGILTGLNSLNWVGQQLGEDQSKRPTDAKQYKLGDTRFTIARDIAALSPVMMGYQRAQQEFLAELPPIPKADPGKPEPPEAAVMQADQNKRSIANQLAMLKKPCDVVPGRLKLQELKLGDAPEQNPIPPSVLAAFSLIVDQ